MKKVVAIIQARVGSTRLPGKVLKDVGGKPMLWYMIDRLKCSEELKHVVIAIPDSIENDLLSKFAENIEISCFRGSENDVLSRYYGAATRFGADVVVRLTSDCPLIDPGITDKIIQTHLNLNADYTSTNNYPRGLDVEVFNIETLKSTYINLPT